MPGTPLHVGTYGFTTQTANVQAVIADPKLRLMGWSVYEDAGTPALASFYLRHGTAATNPIIAAGKLAASGMSTVYFPDGIPCGRGLYLNMTAGSIGGVIYTSREHPE